MKQAVVPEIRALIAPEMMSSFLEGAMDTGKQKQELEIIVETIE